MCFTAPGSGRAGVPFGLGRHALALHSAAGATAAHLDTEVPPSQSLEAEPGCKDSTSRSTPPQMLMDMPMWDDSGNRNLADTRQLSGLNRARGSTNPDDAALDDLLGRLRAADASIDRLLGTNSDQRHS